MKYVPIYKEETKSCAEPDMLSYGASALVKSVTKDIKEDLLAVYVPSDAYAMMALVTLKVIKSAITASRMSTHYHRTFVCKDYPGAAMSQNSVGSFLQRIGMNGSKRRQFYQRRINVVSADHHFAIDGTLKQDNSKVNDLSAYSRKARVRGCNEISALYAYDIERMEPVCAEVFPAIVLTPVPTRPLSATISARGSSLRIKDFRLARSRRNWKNARICTSSLRSNGMTYAFLTTIFLPSKACLPI